ncbi:HAMP domain-containing sensor histidine kinase [Streptomyces atratus]|uniref:sensor histidine kinase n=1 Tax=Streptomyces atratus TaxID=1893 RepID=UPI002AC325D6|nr:HAMP domain-containing sensor histidine kinase [Streptomyces atratus]WPW29047.1 HAMP domain-containing sensor histidine kinase [Streptomyces atratus]
MNRRSAPHRATAAAPAADDPARPIRPRRLTARMKLTLTYALFVVVAGAFTLAVVYLAMRFVPNYPLTAANPRDDSGAPSRQEILQNLLEASGLTLLLLALVGVGGGWFIAGRVLRPLQDITRAARRAADGSLDHRIGLTGPRDEFTDLSDTFDTMLARLQRSFDAQQRFAANASHELRTPLAINRTMLDVATADPDGQDYPRLVARLRETNQRGIEVTDALLQLSALDHTPPTTQPLDLADTAEEALDLVREEARTRGITLSADIHPAPATGDGVLLRQLALNLLHNALRHNLPTGGSLTLTTGPDPVHPGRAVLTVTNTGPLLPDTVDHLTEPFLRGSGRMAEKDPARRGHGLGLAIVAGIVRAHHGDLTLTPNPGGGLTARVSLPSH